MPELLTESQDFEQLVVEHRSWLASFASCHLANWERLLNGNREAACCESAMRRLLASCGVHVEPNERLRSDGGGPDYLCKTNGSFFYIEVTCILRSTATEKTRCSDGQNGFMPFNPFGMSEMVVKKCVAKAKQCRDMDAPCLIAVGTFHAIAGMAGFEKAVVSSVLTGPPKSAWKIDTSSGLKAGKAFQIATAEKAAFLKPSLDRVFEGDRRSIAGAILCNLKNSQCLGALHPDSIRPFDPSLLPQIEFGRVELNRVTRQLRVVWPNGYGG